MESHWCRHCPMKLFRSELALRAHERSQACLGNAPPARNVRPRLTRARPQPAAEQQHPAPASEDPALWDPLDFDMQRYDEQPAQEAGAHQLDEQPARGAGASQPDRQQQQQPPPPDDWTAEQPCLDMQTDIEQAPDQQPLVLDPVTGRFEAANLPRASLDQPSEPGDHAPDHSHLAGLPWESRDLAPILAELPTRARDALLRVLGKPGFSVQNIKWRNGAEFDAFLDGAGAQDWDTGAVPLSFCNRNYNFTFKYRNSIEALHELARSKKAGPLQWDAARTIMDTGERAWSSCQDADWLERNQARLGGTHVLPWAGYNDVSVLERHGDRKFHPVCIFCLLHPSGHMMSRDGYRRIALLPTIDASSFPGSGLDDVKDAGTLSDLQRKIDTASMKIILAPWKRASHQPSPFSGSDGQVRICYPVLAFWIADRKGANALLNVKHFPASFCDAWDLVPRNEMHNFSKEFPPRTAAEMRKVIGEAQDLMHQGKHAKAARRLDVYSLHAPTMTCLDGFNTSTDCHRLIFPDAMHNTSSGLLKHLLDLTETALRNSSQHEDIQERLKLVPSFMELHLPAKGLAAKDITAAQRHSLGACMPVCLVGLVDMEPYIAAFTALLEWVDLRDMRLHTQASLDALREARIRFHDAAVALPGKSWAFPKFWDMYKYEDLIREFGNVAVANASFGERSHIDFKAAKHFTNNHKGSLMSQISNQLRRVDGVRQGLEDMHKEQDVKATSVAQKALQTGQPHLTSRHRRMDYGSLRPRASGRTAEEAALLQRQPELEHLFRAMALHLADYPERDKSNPDGTSLEELPKLNDPKIKVASALGIVFERRLGDALVGATLRAVPCFGRSARPAFDDVAVRGQGEQPWFAQLRLLFSYRANLSGREVPVAFVRWYDAAGRRNRRTGSLTMQHLRWATTKARRGGPEVPYYDVIDVDQIIRPVYIQPDPVEDGFFFYNHFVK